MQKSLKELHVEEGKNTQTFVYKKYTKLEKPPYSSAFIVQLQIGSD